MYVSNRIGKTYAYPVPPHQILNNIFLILLAIVISFLFDDRRKSIQEYVRVHADGAKLTTLNDLSLTPHLISKNLKFLVANTKEMEFPLKFVPEYIIPCGPMIRPAKSVGEVDPDLERWLRGTGGQEETVETVYVNLGTHMRFDEASAVELAKGLRILLDEARKMTAQDDQGLEKYTDDNSNIEGKEVLRKGARNLQVLWKLSRQPGWEVRGSKVHEVLSKEMGEDRIRIVDWIDAEPTAVLDSGGIVCAVHHGGANSFLETCW